MARRLLVFNETESRDSTDPRYSRWFRRTKQDEMHVRTLKDNLENLRCPL